MKKSPQDSISYMGLATDLKTHALLLHLKKLGDYLICEEKISIMAYDVQLFELENQSSIETSYLLKLSSSLQKLLKTPKGIDYIICPSNLIEQKKLISCIASIPNIKGCYNINNQEITKYLPPHTELSSLNVKKIPVN